jgi:hypothetical protein
MPIVQIAQIRIRRGAEVDVPALDPGEFCEAIDTGRLFLGRAPDLSLPNKGNAEVLTDLATPTLDRLFNNRIRDVRGGFLLSAPIPPGGAFVTVLHSDGQPVVLDGSAAQVASARLTYALFAGQKPVRSGIMTVVSDDTIPEPMLTDEHVGRFVMMGGQQVFNTVPFRAAMEDGNTVLRCQNGWGAPLTLAFRMERPDLVAMQAQTPEQPE